MNAHGCGLITQSALPRDLPVRLEIVLSKRQTTARVADVVSLGGTPETWLLGMELDAPGNFWGIEYAPSDWKIEESAPQEEEVATPAAEPVPSPPPASARRWRLTDISAGACYLEGGAPLPDRSACADQRAGGELGMSAGWSGSRFTPANGNGYRIYVGEARPPRSS